MTTSIGPLANPDYYLRMQRSHQAANGYYTGGGEPDGIWWNPAGLLVGWIFSPPRKFLESCRGLVE